MTLAFFSQRKVHPHDLAGYILAQLAGALTAAACLRLAWGHTAHALHLGATQPGHGFSALDAAGLETLMTASLVLMIFFFTSSARTARWTPLGNWLLVATLVWQGAPYTGTSLNPARSIAPALLAPQLANFWVYVAGPLAGALLAAAMFAGFRHTHTLTAKLFHDPRYPSTLATVLPTAHRPPATRPLGRTAKGVMLGPRGRSAPRRPQAGPSRAERRHGHGPACRSDPGLTPLPARLRQRGA